MGINFNPLQNGLFETRISVLCKSEKNLHSPGEDLNVGRAWPTREAMALKSISKQHEGLARCQSWLRWSSEHLDFLGPLLIAPTRFQHMLPPSTCGRSFPGQCSWPVKDVLSNPFQSYSTAQNLSIKRLLALQYWWECEDLLLK